MRDELMIRIAADARAAAEAAAEEEKLRELMQPRSRRAGPMNSGARRIDSRAQKKKTFAERTVSASMSFCESERARRGKKDKLRCCFNRFEFAMKN